MLQELTKLKQGKKASDEDILCLNEEVIGVSFLVDKKEELYFLNFEETGTDFDTLKWQILREFVESKSTLKVCYNTQRSLFPLFTHFPYYDGTFNFIKWAKTNRA